MYNEEMYQHLIAVTNRTLVTGDYLAQIQKVAKLHPKAVILREKDLREQEYEAMAEEVMSICVQENVPCFMHTYAEAAKRLSCRRIHLSIPSLRALVNNSALLAAGNQSSNREGEADTEHLADLHDFEEISVSCHSMEDVLEAAAAGASRVLLGTIFETDCKKGLPGKGLHFLKEVCDASPVPVYAIGGISAANLSEVMKAGAAGGCMMSGFMRI